MSDNEQYCEKRMAATHIRVFKHLKRTLKPKLWTVIEGEIRDHMYPLVHGIVGFDAVKGSKSTGNDWFGRCTPVRHIYQDTSYCSYSETYGGVIWIPIGKGRYLEMQIHG